MMIILILILVLALLGGGGWGYSRYGAVGASPIGLLVVILLVMWFTGNLGVRG